jgi:hypothetical protein
VKTHELANQLDILAKFLRSLPNIELEQTYAEILSSVGNKSLNQTKIIKDDVNPLPEGVEERLREMASSEIESYLNSESGFSVKQLLELAERLNITASKRQRRSALVNLITRYFEAGQMDSIIRSTRKDNSE